MLTIVSDDNRVRKTTLFSMNQSCISDLSAVYEGITRLENVKNLTNRKRDKQVTKKRNNTFFFTKSTFVAQSKWMMKIKSVNASYKIETIRYYTQWREESVCSWSFFHLKLQYSYSLMSAWVFLCDIISVLCTEFSSLSYCHALICSYRWCVDSFTDKTVQVRQHCWNTVK